MSGTIAVLLMLAGCRDAKQAQIDQLVNASGISTNDVVSSLNQGADINGHSSIVFGWTPLISAVYHNKPEIVDLLLDRGADVNSQDNDRKTALDWALIMSNDDTNLIGTLLRHGADPRIGINAFEIARTSPNSNELVRLLKMYRHAGGVTPNDLQ